MIYTIDNSISINATLAKMSDGDTLFLKKGIYKEKVKVLNNNIKITGEDRDNTIIDNNDYYHKIMPDYNECNTFRTYTLYVGGANVAIENLTIKNSAVPSYIYGQAVALHVDGNNFLCENVVLDSAQDTLFTGPLPPDLIIRHKNFLEKPFLKSQHSIQIYKKCIIKGDVDFIFGTATALFEECDIISIVKQNNSNKVDGYIAAPAHNEDCPYGYLFYKCNLIAEDDKLRVFLARPWRDYGTTAFIDCKMDNHILDLGWDKWNNTNRDKTARFFEYNENADLSKREPWAKVFTKSEKEKYVTDFYNYIEKRN